MSAPQEVAVVDPRTGMVLDDLEHQPADLLAAVAFEIRERQRHMRQMNALVEAELIARLKTENRTRATVGEYEISFKAPNQSAWDPDDTEAALRELVKRGWIGAVEATGIIEDRREVRRREAKSLLDRLHGPARELLAQCCEWTQGTPRFDVVRSIPLQWGPES